MSILKKINREAARKRLGPGASGDWFKIAKDTPYAVQVIGPIGNMEVPWVERFQHAHKIGGVWQNQGFEGDGGKLWNLLCINEHTGDPCPSCDIQSYLEDEALLDSLNLANQVQGLLNVIVDGAPMIWAATPPVIGRLQTFWKRHGDMIFDPTKGHYFDVLLSRTSQGWRYGVDLHSIDKVEAPAGWEQKVVDLNELLRPMTQEAMLEILYRTLRDNENVDFQAIFGAAKMKAILSAGPEPPVRPAQEKKAKSKAAPRKKKGK